MPKLKEILGGTKGKNKKLKTISDAQQQLKDLINQGLISGEGPLRDIFGGFNEQEFQQGLVDPALKNFKENILPQIQEKFIAGNQVLGSGMRRGQARAANQLQSDINQLRYNAQQQQKQNRIAGINQALTQETENVYKPATKGLWQGAVEGLASGAGSAAGAAVAG